MKRYGLAEIRGALAELDAKLASPTTITLIGGEVVRERAEGRVRH